MHFELSCSLPNQLIVALSGGPDSIFAVEFLLAGRKQLQLAHFNHGTAHAADAEAFVSAYARKKGLPLIIGRADGVYHNEEQWRGQRMNFLQGLHKVVVTGHNQDDLIETYVHGLIRNGHPRFIHNVNLCIHRPFLNVTKMQMREYCQKHGHEYIDDPSNMDVKYTRNRIRHEIIPQMELINPGFRKMVTNQWKKQTSSD